MKFLLTNRTITNEDLSELPFKMVWGKFGVYNVIADEDNAGQENKPLLSLTDGYVRNLDLPIHDTENDTEQVIQENFDQWPFPAEITGSFSSVILDKISGECVLCNDLIGVYPLYYLRTGQAFFVSNSIILIGIISKCEFDEAGIVQRCMGPEFSTIGSRTILKNCKRLLPGEWIKFSAEGIRKETRYDNSLYQDISSPKQDHVLHREYWNSYKKDVSYSLNNATDIRLALSGGIDSRTLLGAIPSNKNITCVTYGGKDNYETRIARRLARIKDADFRSFSQPEVYFPEPEVLRNYTVETEAVYLCSWLEILENLSLQEKVPFMIGDLTTAITGRSIKKLSGKKFSKDNFYKYYLVGKDYDFEKVSSHNFASWKESVLKDFEKWYNEKRLSRYNIKTEKEELVRALQNDLQEIFNRIEEHRLPYLELVDELFTWYTHSRGPMAKQVLLCNSKFNSYCPSMSMQNLRMASNLHPNLRLSFRFVKKLFGEVEDLKKFRWVPTSQAPMVPQNSPDFIKFPIWGLRARIDQILIQRLMRRKDPTGRYRLFKSNNWAQIYQNPKMEKNLKVYFANNHLGEDYYDYLLRQSIERKNLEQWPFANLEVINASSLNVEIEYILKHRQVKNEI